MIDTIALALWSGAALILVLSLRRDGQAKALRVRARYRNDNHKRR